VAAAGAEVGAAAEAIGEILRRDARSERRSSEEEKAEEGFNGISLQGRAAGVAGEAGKAARFMMPPSRVAPPRPPSGQCGRRGLRLLLLLPWRDTEGGWGGCERGVDESRLMTSGTNGFQGLLSLCGRVVLRVKLVSVGLGSCGRNRFVWGGGSGRGVVGASGGSEAKVMNGFRVRVVRFN
jgi:hypothetical protein